MHEGLRLFIAIELSEEVLRHMAEVAGAFRRHGVTGVRWVRPEGSHLTLKFLGNVPEGQSLAIAQGMEHATRGIAPFSLQVKGAGVFPNIRAPRVLWLGIQGDLEPLRELYSRMEEEMERLGFSREARVFSPHLTLGRMKARLSAREIQVLEEALAAVPGSGAPGFLVKEMSLMQSLLRPEGAAYVRKAAVPLGDALADSQAS